MSTRRLAVVCAGLGQPSSTRLLADQLAAATAEELRRRAVTLDVQVVEVRDHAHDLMNHLLTGFPPPKLRLAIETVVHSDALIAVTPIFNASYSGLFKSFFDVIDNTALVDKPVLIAATGGTARHSLALDHTMRPMFSYLRANVIPTSVFAATEDWGGGSAQDALAGRISRAGGQLADQIGRRPSMKVKDPFDEPTPFEQLLNGN